MKDGKHDPAALGAALGLPAANFEGPLRLITLDLDRTGVCARLPVEQDPGVWACKSAEDKDCFKFGGYTSGGVAETMVIDAPVDLATVELVPLLPRETAPTIDATRGGRLGGHTVRHAHGGASLARTEHAMLHGT